MLYLHPARENTCEGRHYTAGAVAESQGIAKGCLSMDKHNGALSISRHTHSNDNASTISIAISDANGAKILTMEVAPADLMLALTGQYGAGCKYSILPGIQNAGKRREQKEVVIQTGRLALSDDEKLALLAPLEVDGWKAHASNLGNGHYAVDGGYRVTFVRFVEEGKQVCPNMAT